jgi:FtsZ-binding cell division protein ZapB
MKLSMGLGIITIFVGGLLPTTVFSLPLNPIEMSKHSQHSIRLAQAVNYRALVDASNQEERLATQASTNFLAAFEQFSQTTDRNQSLRLTNVLIKTSGQATWHLQRTGNFGRQSLGYYRADRLAQTALDSVYRLQLELAEIYRGYNQLSQQTRTALQSNNSSRLIVLSTKFQMLNERRVQIIQLTQEISQAYVNRSQAANAQLIKNFYTRMANGILERGQATKCMVSNLPYGSPAQIASRPSAYCNR